MQGCARTTRAAPFRPKRPKGILERMTSMTDLKPVEELTFEEALEELEELTSSMASGEATLKESVAGYARGTALLKRCRRELEEARRTIETLREESGNEDVVPF